MAQSLAQILLIFSLAGLGFILYKKIPVLKELPETQIKTPGFKKFFLKLKNKINFQKYFPSKNFWEKIILKIRILALKVENKTFSWQKKLKEKSKKTEDNKDFWKDLKGSIK